MYHVNQQLEVVSDHFNYGDPEISHEEIDKVLQDRGFKKDPELFAQHELDRKVARETEARAVKAEARAKAEQDELALKNLKADEAAAKEAAEKGDEATKEGDL